MAAQAVLNGDMTLGMMLSVQYIIARSTRPLIIVSFIREYQDAKLSLERIGEIHSLEPEDASIKNKSIRY